MMSDDEIIAIVHARKQGKKLQLRHMATAIDPDPVWYDLPTQVGQWGDFYRFNYRVAPEPRKVCACCGKDMDDGHNHLPRKPREWVCYLSENGSIVSGVNSRGHFDLGMKSVIVREVIE